MATGKSRVGSKQKRVREREGEEEIKGIDEGA
jgi:hypothetical protein